MGIRPEIAKLQKLGPLPSESGADVDRVRQYQELIEVITRPISNEEARALCDVLPDTEESCFGLAWTLVYLVESAPAWPIAACLNSERPWIVRLKQRAIRGGMLQEGAGEEGDRVR